MRSRAFVWASAVLSLIATWSAKTWSGMSRRRCRKKARSIFSWTFDSSASVRMTRLPPDISQIPLIHQRGRRFGISGFDPEREKTALCSFEEKTLVEINPCDLLHGLDVVTRDGLVTSVEEFDTGFFEGTLNGRQLWVVL